MVEKWKLLANTFPVIWLLNASVHLYQSFYFLPIKIIEYCESLPLIQGILPLCSPSPKLSSKVYSRFSVSPFPLCINLSILPKLNSFLTIHWSFSHQEQQWILLLPWASWLYLRRFSSRFQKVSHLLSLKYIHGARVSFRFCWLLTLALFSAFPLPILCRLKFWIQRVCLTPFYLYLKLYYVRVIYFRVFKYHLIVNNSYF